MEISNILDLAMAADEFLLNDLINLIQDYLTNTKVILMPKYLCTILQFSFKNPTFNRLQRYMVQHLNNHPWKLTISYISKSLDEETLMTLLTEPNQHINQSTIWDIIIKWGIAH